MSFSRQIFSLLVLIQVLSIDGASLASEPETTPLTLLTFNLHLGGVGPGGNADIAHYFFRHVLDLAGIAPSQGQLFDSLDRTASFIDELDPDVVLINEFSPWGLLAPFTKHQAESDPRKNAVRKEQVATGRRRGHYSSATLGETTPGYGVAASAPGGCGALCGLLLGLSELGLE